MLKFLHINILCVFIAASGNFIADAAPQSIFYPDDLICRARINAEKYSWAAKAQNDIIKKAQPWVEMSDSELWSLMFAPTLERSWMVWSNGYCPSCKKSVPMYNWVIDAWKHPWKVACPHCNELFPKNDFEKYYISGLDAGGVFRYENADKKLLFNEQHPGESDALYQFGVDDGHGYSDGENRWHFISTYLVYGQWMQKVIAGINALSDAYVVTADTVYAHKAVILIDRVADFYPDFDFKTQGWMYENINYSAGYITYWQRAGQDSRDMAQAFDKIRSGLSADSQLFEFLSEKSKKCGLNNPKNCYADVESNIFERIFIDSINNPGKIFNNFPIKEESITVMKTVMYWPQQRSQIMEEIKKWMARAVSVDGVTGEKGGYSKIGPTRIMNFLSKYDRVDSGFLKEMMNMLPELKQTFRFHIDTRVLDGYNILPGDGSNFAQKEGYPIVFPKIAGLEPSVFDFYWRLYELTGDIAYIQLLYNQNDNRLEGLPYDIFCKDQQAVQTQIEKVINKEGFCITGHSVDKKNWHLAILKSGNRNNERAVWIDYDNIGNHRHYDAMTMGLYAKGLNLMVDFGYPPVQFAGWQGPRFEWYQKTVGHNTVVVDGKDVADGAGHVTLWADGEQLSVVRTSGPNLIKGLQYERTAVMVNISDTDFYVVDIFRVVGGKDHAKFMNSTFGTISTEGLSLSPANEYGNGALMRDFKCDRSPSLPWSVDWKVEDYYNYLPQGSDIHLKYTDLSKDVQAYTAQAWIVAGGFDSIDERWVPRIMIQRSGPSPLSSTFVGVIEPYEKISNIEAVRRLNLENSTGQSFNSANLALEISLAGGGKNLIIAMDSENPLGLKPACGVENIFQNDWGVEFNGEVCMIRLDGSGNIRNVIVCHGKFLNIGKLTLELKAEEPYTEIMLKDGQANVVRGNPLNLKFSEK